MFNRNKKQNNIFVEDPNKPIFLSIESYHGMNKKQLEKYIYGLVEKNVKSLRGANYQIIKFEKGYVVEIQEGGNGYGSLQSVLRHLEDHSEAIIETSSNRKVKVVKKNSSNGTLFKSYTLNEGDNTPTTDSIAFVDQLKPVITSGYAFWRLSIGIAVIGLATMFSGAIFKHIVYDTTDKINFHSSGKVVPLKQLNDILIAKPQSGNYISAIRYKNGSWSREEKELKAADKKTTTKSEENTKNENTELQILNDVLKTKVEVSQESK